MQDLKVAQPDKFYFKPKRLLAAIAQIYLNLGEEPDFIRAVANDGRSYSKELFERFARILKNRAIMTGVEVQQVEAFIGRVEVARATIALEDEVEVPDEYLDPLMATGKVPFSTSGVHTADNRSDEESRHLTNLQDLYRQGYDQKRAAVEAARPVQQPASQAGGLFAGCRAQGED